MQKLLHLLSLCSFGGLALACAGTDSSSNAVDALTLMAVDPTDFQAACGSPAGSGSYVAELIDVTQRTDVDINQESRKIPSFPAQSSPATACDRSVAFGRVVVNREYVARVSTYADTDGDPSTVDVCTREGTSVAVTRENGECTSHLAQPVSRLSCYGWRKPGAVNSLASSGVAGSAGTAVESPSQELTASPAVAGCEGDGCGGVAIEHRTMALRYCVSDAH
ncbi:MAG TPA: hypothetical protein VKP30_34060 [Polyangiaceae bacterium]|nr:hypothetical protein [Polyangiaceae bacterium]